MVEVEITRRMLRQVVLVDRVFAGSEHDHHVVRVRAVGVVARRHVQAVGVEVRHPDGVTEGVDGVVVRQSVAEVDPQETIPSGADQWSGMRAVVGDEVGGCTVDVDGGTPGLEGHLDDARIRRLVRDECWLPEGLADRWIDDGDAASHASAAHPAAAWTAGDRSGSRQESCGSSQGGPADESAPADGGHGVLPSGGRRCGPGRRRGRRPVEGGYGRVRIGDGVASTWAEGPRALVDQTLNQ